MARAGLTFVEVLVVMVLFSVMAAAILVLGQTGKNTWKRTGIKMTNMAIAQQAMNRITQDVRVASSDAACLTCAGEILTLEGKDLAGACDPATRVTYQRLATGELRRTVGGVAQTIAAGLAAFTPSCLPDGVINLEVTAQVDVSQGPMTQTVVSQARARNP